MKPLDKALRNKLERTVKEARCIAEAAAGAALQQLGVGEPAPYSYLSEGEKEIRRKLRAHGRQLGDVRDSRQRQELDRLIEEVAYEHWHRMLFARFLAENNLLMYPDPDDPVAVTLQECEDLAADEGAKNGWELASYFAARMLPQIFRPDSPVFKVDVPPEHHQKLERMLADLPQEVFTASDALGWVYQFWQAKKKDEINASEVKIGARELPAVTQLFTEPYMVSFLLDNSLGAWWAARRLTETDFREAETEEELRGKASLPGVPLEYLRFVKNDDGAWTPAAGAFENWPDKLADFRVLDPCCGSGHFLVSALVMLVPMRMELEGLSARDAVDSVLRANLHGLEIDQRCVELAAFALAFMAWRYPGTGGYRKLPELNLACTGLSVGVGKEEWTRLALDKHNLRIALDWMYDLFKEAPVLGSLLNPTKSKAAKIVSWNELSKAVSIALEKRNGDDDQRHEAGVVAHGLAKAAILLSRKYDWIITNVPYLGKIQQVEELRVYCKEHFPLGKGNLATSFLLRATQFLSGRGIIATVSPQSWLYQDSYEHFREFFLRKGSFLTIAALGPTSFETISGHVVNVSLSLWKMASNAVDDSFVAWNLNRVEGPEGKADALKCRPIQVLSHSQQLANQAKRIVLSYQSPKSTIETYVFSTEGLSTGDADRLIRRFWELPNIDHELWELIQDAPGETQIYDGLSFIVKWEEGRGYLSKSSAARIRGHSAWGKAGVIIGRMSRVRSALYLGGKFTKSAVVLTPSDAENLPAIYAYASSSEFEEAVRTITSNLNIATSILEQVPFELDRWANAAKVKYPYGLPQPYSGDPIQWIFHGHPAQSTEPLQVAVARMLAYRWPAQLSSEMQLSGEARDSIEKTEALLTHATPDGIICIPPVRGEAPAADRLLNLLAAAYGDLWSSDKLSELLSFAGHAGKTLDSWLRDKFFAQHCALFHHRPFIWHIWDGIRDGFGALVNYHKLDRKNLENLIYSYLGDWINKQKQDLTTGIDGAEEKLEAAENLKKRLELILEGESPYDIFVRWKPLEKQLIGWAPDINDGVRLNIRPFLTVPDVGKRGAGVLRDKPNINWNKDRGKDVPSAPWYNLGPKYGGNEGDRINDHHLTLAEKFDARAGKGG